jgi:D-lactate dehydrogenase (cytochrome)
MTPALRDAAAGRLASLFGSRFSTSSGITGQFIAREGHTSTQPPWAVVHAESTEDVQAVHRISQEFGIPLIPFGAGTSVEGQISAQADSLALDMRGMNKVISVDTAAMTATVQAGVTRVQLDGELRSTGLFFPVDPGADATIGGMAATRASGTNAVRYGTMAQNTLAATVVLASGELIRCGSLAPKSASGYDLLHLFVGSEGTLGTFAEITLRLCPRPEAIAGAVFCFPGVGDAVEAVVQMRQAAIPIARVELFDAATVKALNAHANLGLPESPLLLVELHGSASFVDEQYQAVRSVVEDFPGTTVLYADDRTGREKLWQACHRRYYACKSLRPGASAIATDVCVPISRLAQTIEATLEDIEDLPMPATLHGHVGDGNFHTVVLIDPLAPDEQAAFKRYSERLALRAIEAGGTCTGEHGVGLGKQRYLEREHGASLRWMQAVKALFDPANLMNPGKHIDVRAV